LYVSNDSGPGFPLRQTIGNGNCRVRDDDVDPNIVELDTDIDDGDGDGDGDADGMAPGGRNSRLRAIKPP